MASKRTIIIAGAGIAGLTSALTLAKAGFRIQIIEKAERIDEAGVGIQLSPNATGILAELGLSRTIAAAGFSPDNVIVKNGYSGKELSRFPLGETIQKRHAHPYLVLHRADLATILLSACKENPEIGVNFNTSFEDAAMHRNGITVMALRSGKMVDYSGCALIGADGVSSEVRSRIIHSAKAKPTGDVAWRALIPVNRLPPNTDLANTRLWIAKNGHVVTYPVRTLRFLNVVAITPSDIGGDISRRTLDIDPHRMETFFSIWHQEIRQLIDCAESWSGWPMREINPKGDWSKECTALIGDAAHAMLPYLAQGGAAAIEDAAVLAKCLSESLTSIPQGLENYVKLRRKRTGEIWKSARTHGQIYHMGEFSAFARDTVMRAANSRLLAARESSGLHKKMDWLYGWKA